MSRLRSTDKNSIWATRPLQRVFVKGFAFLGDGGPTEVLFGPSPAGFAEFFPELSILHLVD
jgi:hypothetical protein